MTELENTIAMVEKDLKMVKEDLDKTKKIIDNCPNEYIKSILSQQYRKREEMYLEERSRLERIKNRIGIVFNI